MCQGIRRPMDSVIALLEVGFLCAHNRLLKCKFSSLNSVREFQRFLVSKSAKTAKSGLKLANVG